MTDVRLNKSNRYFKQYKFNIDSITNKACWIIKWTVFKIICNDNSICVTLLLVMLSRWIQIQHNAAFSWRILNQQAVCLHKNIFTNLHDMQRELSHIKSSLIMSNHCKLMSCDWLPPFAYFIIYRSCTSLCLQSPKARQNMGWDFCSKFPHRGQEIIDKSLNRIEILYTCGFALEDRWTWSMFVDVI